MTDGIDEMIGDVHQMAREKHLTEPEIEEVVVVFRRHSGAAWTSEVCLRIAASLMTCEESAEKASPVEALEALRAQLLRS